MESVRLPIDGYLRDLFSAQPLSAAVFYRLLRRVRGQDPTGTGSPRPEALDALAAEAPEPANPLRRGSGGHRRHPRAVLRKMALQPPRFSPRPGLATLWEIQGRPMYFSASEAGGGTDMADGIIQLAGAGARVETAGLDVTFKVTAADAKSASSFELLVRPGFDVGAHIHRRLEELFYLVEGELDLLAFEPRERSPDGWHDWQSSTGERAVRGGPGTLMFVPIGCPHAFANPGTIPARVLLQVAPPGHEL